MPPRRGETTSWPPCSSSKGPTRVSGSSSSRVPWPWAGTTRTPIRLHDTEVSRRHAELRQVEEAYRIVDLGSANGTYVNGQPVDQAPLQFGRPAPARPDGDALQRGDGQRPARPDGPRRHAQPRAAPTTARRSSRASPRARARGSSRGPTSAAGWLRERLVNLSVMYRATQAISHVLEIDALLPQILELVFESIGADRGAILLKDDGGSARPQGGPLARPADPDERMTISRTIVDYVLEQGRGRHHHRRPHRQAVQPRAVDRRLPDPRGHLRADPGPAHHARRPLRRHPVRCRRGHGRRRGQGRRPRASSPRTTSCSWSPSATRPGWRSRTRSSTTTRSRPSGWPPSARRSPPSRITSRTSSRASAAAAT